VNLRALQLLLAVLPVRPLAAQIPRFQHYLGGELGISRPRFQSASPGGGEKLSGLVLGGRLHVALHPVSLDVSYSQGRLTADTGSAAARALVEGSVLVVARPLNWLALKAGPHLRAYAAPGGTERWVLWEARAHADAPILEGKWVAYGELWLAVASSVNVDPGSAGARGAEAGLSIKVPGSPVWARLAYLVDQSRLANSTRTESLQSIALSIELAARVPDYILPIGHRLR
jgi:hypothetical protein